MTAAAAGASRDAYPTAGHPGCCVETDGLSNGARAPRPGRRRRKCCADSEKHSARRRRRRRWPGNGVAVDFWEMQRGAAGGWGDAAVGVSVDVRWTRVVVCGGCGGGGVSVCPWRRLACVLPSLLGVFPRSLVVILRAPKG